MDGIVTRFIEATAKKNFWRFRGYYELEDLVQDGVETFLRCKAKYPKYKPNQLMGAFKRAYPNYLTDLARKKRTQDDGILMMIQRELDAPGHEAPITSAALALCPEPIKRAITALATDPHALKTWLWIDGGWETPNQKLCRIAGISEGDTPLINHVEAWLREAGFAHTYG